MHVGDSTTPTDGQLYPNYKQLGVRVPGIVVSNLARPRQVLHQSPFEHYSSLALIESIFGLTSLLPRGTSATASRSCSRSRCTWSGPPPSRRARTSSARRSGRRLLGRQPAAGVPGPVNHPPRIQTFGEIPGLTGTSEMADLLRNYRRNDGQRD
jgi:hypothetical protein